VKVVNPWDFLCGLRAEWFAEYDRRNPRGKVLESRGALELARTLMTGRKVPALAGNRACLSLCIQSPYRMNCMLRLSVVLCGFPSSSQGCLS
jgi:hypothetical protein